jgi:cysteine desulfurase/selenocysteine lyase
LENATIAWQMAFYALPFRAGDRILTAEAEYAANYVAFLQVAKRTGAIIEIVPSDASGELDIRALERMIDERVKLIAIT